MPGGHFIQMVLWWTICIYCTLRVLRDQMHRESPRLPSRRRPREVSGSIETSTHGGGSTVSQIAPV
jgi:hypothetical protein